MFESTADIAVTGDISNLENEMFITTDEALADHKYLDGIEIGILDEKDAFIFGCPAATNIKNREILISNFHVILEGWSITPKDTHRLRANLTCFTQTDWLHEYRELVNQLKQFAAQKHHTLAFVLHPHQTNESPHLHIIYTTNDNNEHELEKYLKTH